MSMFSLFALLGKFKSVHPLWKSVWHYPEKMIVHMPYDLAIPDFGMFKKEILVHVHV